MNGSRARQHATIAFLAARSPVRDAFHIVRPKRVSAVFRINHMPQEKCNLNLFLPAGRIGTGLRLLGSYRHSRFCDAGGGRKWYAYV